MWRSLRDGYIRYKKHLKGESVSDRKYCYFTWSSQLQFLDEALKLRSKTSKSTPLRTESEVLLPESTRISDSTLPQQSSLEPAHSSAASQSPSQSQPWAELSPPSLDFNSSPQTSLPMRNNISQSPSSSLLLQKIMKYENIRGYDAVDLLFMSYADTFRKLSKRKQVELKMTLAELFATAELSEMDDECLLNEPQTSSAINHSKILDEPTQQSCVAVNIKSELNENTQVNQF